MSDQAMSSQPDPIWLNKQYLLGVIMKQCGITESDLKNQEIVRSKVRESRIESILENN